MKTQLLTIILIILSTFLTAQIIHVPKDQPNIQAGIDNASDGDTVLVSEGTYYENINFIGKAITVASHFLIDNDTLHISNTKIDGSWPSNPQKASVITFDSGEDTTSIICGFTITGGTGSHVPGYGWAGGGIYCYPAGAMIIHNYIENNIVTSPAMGFGGGMMCDPDGEWVVIKNNIIRNNEIHSELEGYGGGVNFYSNAIVNNNIITNNKIISTGASIGPSMGGGIHCDAMFDPKEIFMQNNIISNNKVLSEANFAEGGSGGGLLIYGTWEGVVSGNTISNNEVSATLYCYGAGAMIEFTDNELTFENNVINHNKATWGGGVYIDENVEDILQIINNTIVENEATDAGGGICFAYTDTTVVLNTLLWNNIANQGSEIYINEGELEVHYCDIKGGWPDGWSNIDLEPALENDYIHLSPCGSNCINAGTDAMKIFGEWYYCPDFDIDGDQRPFESTYPDIGADESDVELIISEINGRKIKLIIETIQPPGEYKIKFDASSLPSGIYLCTLKTNDFVHSCKIVLLNDY